MSDTSVESMDAKENLTGPTLRAGLREVDAGAIIVIGLRSEWITSDHTSGVISALLPSQ